MKKHRLTVPFKPGLPPGTLVPVGKRRGDKTKISLIDYNEKQISERVVSRIEDVFPFKDKPSVTWINIDGLHDLKIMQKTGDCFNIHPLVLEDILQTDQRPKIEDYTGYILLIFQMITYNPVEKDIEKEQVSLILGKNFIISFQEEKEGDVFESIRECLRHEKGRIRKMGADYLAYSIMDSVVDNYFVALEGIGESIEELEELIIDNPSPVILQQLHHIRRTLLFLRKSVWPLREVVARLEKGESGLISRTIRPFFRDLYDNTIQAIDILESMRDVNSGIFDLYISNISYKTNEIMKVLTIIATIFIPLTFIAGVYGMNFKYMPEINWKPGYFVVTGIMIAIGCGMAIVFKRRKWF